MTKAKEHTAYDCREFVYERGDWRCKVCGRKERYVSRLDHAKHLRETQEGGKSNG